jgi:hypothetical protein
MRDQQHVSLLPGVHSHWFAFSPAATAAMLLNRCTCLDIALSPGRWKLGVLMPVHDPKVSGSNANIELSPIAAN